MVGWLIGRSVGQLVGWLVGWLVGGRLVDRSVGWSIGRLVGQLVGGRCVIISMFLPEHYFDPEAFKLCKNTFLTIITSICMKIIF